MSATMVVAEDRTDVDPKVWTPAHVKVIKAAAQDPEVERIFVNRGDQEGAVPRSRQRPRVAEQGAAVVGARLSLPRPDLVCPGRQPGMHAAAAAARGRRLRQGTRPLVHRRDPASHAVARAAEAEARAAHGRSAGRLPAAYCWRRRPGRSIAARFCGSARRQKYAIGHSRDELLNLAARMTQNEANRRNTETTDELRILARARKEGAVARELDHPPRQSSAREHRRPEGRRPSGLLGVARHHHDRALFPRAASAGSRGGQAACEPDLSRHPISARPAEPAEARGLPRLQGRAELSLAHQGHRRRRLLHRLGRARASRRRCSPRWCRTMSAPTAGAWSDPKAA